MEKNILYQVSLLQALTLGHYEGVLPVGEIRKHGDFGLGTFHGLDGEMIFLDGVLYRADGKGEVTVPADSATVPFCDVTFFSPDTEKTMSGVGSAKELGRLLEEEIRKKGRNYFYAFRMDTVFRSVTVRSEIGQKKPYRRLDEVMKTDQVTFSLSRISGTLMGLYCPPYMDRLNMPGWHFHFLSADRKAGGHVLDVSFDRGAAQLALLSRFETVLPETDSFGSLDLTQDLQKEIASAEG